MKISLVWMVCLKIGLNVQWPVEHVVMFSVFKDTNIYDEMTLPHIV